jgi:hypothetical protein
MTWHLQFRQTGGLIETIYSGTISPPELEASVLATLALSAEKKASRFLVDGRAMQGGHTMMDLYAQMETVLKHSFAEPPHEAIVLAPEAPAEVAENIEFWAAALRLRGYDVQIFIERAQALAWLQSA